MTVESDNATNFLRKTSLNKTIFLFRKKTRLKKEKLNLPRKVKSKSMHYQENKE